MSSCDVFNCLFSTLDFSFLVFFTGSARWITAAVKILLLSMAGFLVEKFAACQSHRESDFGWHGFVFHLAWCVRGLKSLNLCIIQTEVSIYTLQSSRFFENQPNEICSHLREKASKGRFLKPEELQNHSNEGKGKEKEKEKEKEWG